MIRFIHLVVFCSSIAVSQAQFSELVHLEFAKAPKALQNMPPHNLGTRLTFFVNDTATVTGLTSNYGIEEWSTSSGKDLNFTHKELTLKAVKENYRMARDTAILDKGDFWVESGIGFSFKLHNWALPDTGSTGMNVKGNLSYTVLEPGDVLSEDITHLAGNFGFETLSMDFKGNTIELKKLVYGRGEDAYTTFSGAVLNNNHEFAIQNMQFLDFDGKVLDELYFGLNNQYGTNTRNQIDLTGTSVMRIQYRKIKVKKVFFNETIAFWF